MRVVTADAREVSGADFLKHVLGERRPTELNRLCAELMRAAMDGDMDKCAELRKQIKDLSPPTWEPRSELRRTGTGGWL